MKYLLCVIFGLACLFLFACNERAGVEPTISAVCLERANGGDFKFEAVYNKIRSQPEGGGVFITQIIPGDSFNGTVKLSLNADPALHAELDRDFLDFKNRVAEITIKPDSLIEIRNYRIVLIAQNEDMIKILEFAVEIFPGESQVSDWAIRKRDEFMFWLMHEHPEYSEVADQKWFVYNTYPQIWIVEHWTFLSEEWEMRICFHVMIPPYDWSMMRLRKRGEAEAELAARKDTDSGTIYEIPVADYPLMFGY
jgi:hypothetical protein